MSAHEQLQLAIEEFQRRLNRVGDDQWHLATPCAEWDVRALVNHVVGELRWVPPLLEGKTIAEVGDALSGDLLGGDPKQTWSLAAESATDAASQEGALERTVHLSYGDRPAGAYVRELSSDVVIHTWDLARGIGADDRLDPGLVELAGTAIKPQLEEARAAGYFGPRVEVPAGADPQTALLALTGRHPDG